MKYAFILFIVIWERSGNGGEITSQSIPMSSMEVCQQESAKVKDAFRAYDDTVTVCLKNE